MEKIRKKRGASRASFTKTLNILKSELSKDVKNKGVIRDAVAKIDKMLSDIWEFDQQIIDLIAEDEDSTEESILAEIEENDKYSDEYITIKRLVSEFLNDDKPVLGKLIPSDSLNSDSKQKYYKYPKLSIKPFDGSLINYLSFWAQFSKIHEDVELDDCDKFQYLLQSVQPNTRAKELLESYPITSENYPKAVSAFQDRFGNEELLVEVYVREFLKLIILNVQSNSRDRLPLTDLFTKVDAYLRSLESLGLDSTSNSAWLYPMVESSLPEDILKAWQRYSLLGSGQSEDVPKKSNLDLLMNFLRREVEGEERLKLARTGFEENNVVRNKSGGKEKNSKRENKVPTAASLFSAKELTCIFCEKSHESKDCIAARSLSLQERSAKVKEKNCCLKCLRKGHRAKACKIFIRCHVCSKTHTELFCPELVKMRSGEKKAATTEIVQSTVTQKLCSKEIALMTVEVNIKGDSSKRVRALFDSGSQKSYILKRTANEIGLKAISTENLAHCLFGGSHIEAKPHCKYRVNLIPLGNRKATFEFDFLDQEVICGNLPRVPMITVSRELKKHKIWLTDVGTGCPEIELLLGSDIYGQLLTGRVKQLSGGLTAIETKLGWTVCGHIGGPEELPCTTGAVTIISNLAMREMKVPELWKLETIGILDPAETVSKAEEEELAHDHFIKEVRRNEDGRYCVGLPWISEKTEIPCNRQVAEKRLMTVTRKLKSMGKINDYSKVFQEWEQEGVISKVSDTVLRVPGHYLPHHPVIKPQSSSTTIRPVFDASCKLGRAPSLNDCLFKGPNLIEQIPSILLRFREKPIAVTADIRRAFLQIEVHERDRQFLRFLWWENPEKIQVYQHNRVIFGATCSPFLLAAVIKLHLSDVSEDQKEVASKLVKSFYVDNLVTSVDNIDELEDFIMKSTELMEDAKMTLRMWEYGPLDEKEPLGCSKLLQRNPETIVPVLGLLWDKREDCLMINNQLDKKIENPTKRQILSIVQGIFDPLGSLTPALLPGKLMMQETWSTKTDWDTPIPEKIQKDFSKWYNELEYLSSVKIPRRIGYGDKQSWSVHTFCDASQKAYATVIFLRCEDEKGISVQLLSAKSRLSPKANITIPRLELLACVLGARLTNYIQKSLALDTISTYYWTDSSTVLAWISRNNQWGTFVGNRVREICNLTEVQQWRFISGHLNPADLPSRGCHPQQFLKSRWWEGPDWLRKPGDEWPKLETTPQEELVEDELRKTVAMTVDCTSEAPFMNFERMSRFSRIINVICWIRRFILGCKNKMHRFAKELSAEEREAAENLLWLNIQKESFGEVTDSVKGLVVVKDQNNIVRVKTKLLDRDDEFSFRYPILLPSKHHVVSCLIRDCHLKHCHAGPQTVRTILREKFWIISSKRNIKNVLSKCVRCKRFSARACATPPIHLPSDRVRDSKVFEVVGIDLCGPLFLKQKGKVWIVLFTCAVYRAIHLELVTDLSTEGFIQALRRFVARRGRPTTIYTDNGTNFKGTNNILKSLDWKKIETSEHLVSMRWRFIPPTAAWWGGWWERLIRSIKALLIRTLGRSSLNMEELATVLCDVEATVNSRPLTCVNDEIDSFLPLTPSMFIQDIVEVGVPDLDKIDSNKLQTRYKVCQSLREELRGRFRKEYLAELVQKASEQGKTIKIGDLVLIENANKRRLNWHLGRVTKLLPSRDGCARVAEVKTASGTFIRPLRKLYPLEVSNDDPVIKSVTPERTTRSGRVIRPPKSDF